MKLSFLFFKARNTRRMIIAQLEVYESGGRRAEADCKNVIAQEYKNRYTHCGPRVEAIKTNQGQLQSIWGWGVISQLLPAPGPPPNHISIINLQSPNTSENREVNHRFRMWNIFKTTETYPNAINIKPRKRAVVYVFRKVHLCRKYGFIKIMITRKLMIRLYGNNNFH